MHANLSPRGFSHCKWNTIICSNRSIDSLLLLMWWLLKERFVLCQTMLSILCSFSADSSCQLNVLGQYWHALGVDGAQVGVFKQTNKVSLATELLDKPSQRSSGNADWS